MNWKAIFTSSLGRKLVMGASGIFLILFLFVHCFINSLMFFDDTGALFTEYASFMSENAIIRVLEIGIFLGLIVHIVEALIITLQNMKTRSVKYKVKPKNQTSKWFSRYMGVLGSLILLFLVIHLGEFWLPNRTGAFKEESEMFAKMVNVFQSPVSVAIYVLGCIALSYHLLHGFQSAFRTLGWMHASYKSLIYGVGFFVSVIIPTVFAAMPIWMHFHQFPTLQ